MSKNKASLTASAGLGDEGIDFAEDLEMVDGSFFEEAQGPGPDEESTVGDFAEEFVKGSDGIDEIQDALEEIEEDLNELGDDFGEEVLPGSSFRESELESQEDEGETDYANDGDLSKFMEYVSQVYPGDIPQHDGESISGCERAVSFLGKLDSEMSRAVRDDTDGQIDLSLLEDTRLNVMKDVMVLKNHLSKLKKKFKDSHKKNASTVASEERATEGRIPTWMSPSGAEVKYSDLKKEASTPNNMVIAITAFERAISGIMINAHVSAGNDMEEVYGFLSKKYDITPREELSIMQVVADSGYHIFKDRGTYCSGDSKEKDTNNRGVDFIKNYFA